MVFRIRDVEPLHTLPGINRTEFMHNLWVSALWETVLPSKTLVDVVAGIFTGVTSAVQAVKDGLSAAWDGVRSAGEFIADTVIRTILTSMRVSLVEAFSAFFSVLASQLGGTFRRDCEVMTIGVFGRTVILEIVQGQYTLDFTANGSSIYVFDSFGVEMLGLSSEARRCMLLYFALSLLSAFMILTAKSQGASGMTLWPLLIGGVIVGMMGFFMVFIEAMSRALDGRSAEPTLYEWNRVFGGLFTMSVISVIILELLSEDSKLNLILSLLALLVSGSITGIAPWVTIIDDDGITDEVILFIISGVSIQMGVLLGLKSADSVEIKTPSLDAYKIFLLISIILFGVLFLLTGGIIDAISFI